MFCLPVRSGSNPVESVSSVAEWPQVSIDPASGRMIPAIASRSVLLPEPLRPTTPSTSPLRRVKLTSRTAQNFESRPTSRRKSSAAVLRKVRSRVSRRSYWIDRPRATIANSSRRGTALVDLRERRLQAHEEKVRRGEQHRRADEDQAEGEKVGCRLVDKDRVISRKDRRERVQQVNGQVLLRDRRERVQAGREVEPD